MPIDRRKAIIANKILAQVEPPKAITMAPAINAHIKLNISPTIIDRIGTNVIITKMRNVKATAAHDFKRIPTIAETTKISKPNKPRPLSCSLYRLNPLAIVLESIWRTPFYL